MRWESSQYFSRKSQITLSCNRFLNTDFIYLVLFVGLVGFCVLGGRREEGVMLGVPIDVFVGLGVEVVLRLGVVVQLRRGVVVKSGRLVVSVSTDIRSS